MKEIEIDGMKYTIDLQKAIQMGLIKKALEIKVGNYYAQSNCGTKYQLVSVLVLGRDYCCLVYNGGLSFWSNAVPVSDRYNISLDEWHKITNGKAFEEVI